MFSRAVLCKILKCCQQKPGWEPGSESGCPKKTGHEPGFSEYVPKHKIKFYSTVKNNTIMIYLNCYIRDALIPTAPGRLLAYDTTPGRGKENIIEKRAYVQNNISLDTSQSNKGVTGRPTQGCGSASY
jgi:hypothetical protein